MKYKLFILLLFPLGSSAQFKAGTFGIGPSISINYSKDNYGYNSKVELGINGNVFVSKRSAIGMGFYNDNSSYSKFNSELNRYNLNFQFYSESKHLIGFLNQTDINFTNDLEFNSHIKYIQLVNYIGIFTKPYKGLVFNIKYLIVGYSYYIEKYKNTDYEFKSNTFSMNLNPFVNISSLQFDFVYYLNLRRDEK